MELNADNIPKNQDDNEKLEENNVSEDGVTASVSGEDESLDMKISKDYSCSYLKVMAASIRAKSIVREAKAKNLPFREVALLKTKYHKPVFTALDEIDAGLISYRRKPLSHIGELSEEAEKRRRKSEIAEGQ